MRLTLLGRPGCHLCEEMREVVEEVGPEFGVVLEERDVRADPADAAYLWEIPVLLLGEREVVRHRVDAEELRARLRAALARP